MKSLILFDVDGTLTIPRQKINQNMVDTLCKLNQMENIDIGFVGGSDLCKQIEQLGEENMKLFKWHFSENGLLSFCDSELIHKQSFVDYIGEEKYQRLVNAILEAFSKTVLPKKRGNFIELRNGMVNISPIGRSCSTEEREEFYQFDLISKIKEKVITDIKQIMGSDADDLTFSIGGQISIDVFPTGWDKRYALQFVESKYDKIYFFGDKTMKGGNDYEIFNDPRVIGNTVVTFNDTIEILQKLFNL
jgi:phosphomannomutase